MAGIVEYWLQAFIDTVKRQIMSPVIPAIIAASSAVVSSTATAQMPDVSVPVYRIKSPFAGAIWRLDVDKSENFAVLSNAYKATNLWRLDDPATPTFLRTPLGRISRNAPMRSP